MTRYRTNGLALIILCLALIAARAHASPRAAASAACPDKQAVAWSSDAPAPVHDDDRALRLAEAARDLQAAEQAVRDDPSLAAVFGPMLRQARANLEAGLAAVAATTRIEVSPPDTGTAHAIDTAMPSPISTPFPAATPEGTPGRSGLPPHRGRHARPMIWA